MYKEYEQINQLLAEANLLDKTDRTLKDIFHIIFDKNPNNIAQIFIDEDDKVRKLTYKKVKSKIYKYAYRISQIFNQKHEVIVLKMATSPEWGNFFWALLLAGYKPLLIDPKVPKENVNNLIAQSHAVGIICEDHKQYNVKSIKAEDIIYDEIKEIYHEDDFENEVIFCSSGTTGDVKMVIFNGDNLSSQIQCALDMALETKDIMFPKQFGKIRNLAMIPFHHIFGFVAIFLWFTYYGKAIVYPSSSTPSDIQYACQRFKVTHVFSVPLFWDSLALNASRKIDLLDENKKKIINNFIDYNLEKTSEKIPHYNIVKKQIQKMLLGPNVRFCISGGGFLSSKTLEFINGIGYPLHNGYGMTEIGVTSVDLSSSLNTRLDDTIGHPLHGVDYKINENGELLIKSQTIHTKEIIKGNINDTNLDDGYFHSGDIVAEDKSGYKIKGRIKDIIVNADGENIFPDEMELYFKNLPHVNNLCFLGIKKENSQDEIIVLAIEPDNSITDNDIKELEKIIKNISLPHKVKIERIYLCKTKLPLANNMKVKRFVVKHDIENNSTNYVLAGSKHEIKKIEGYTDEEIAKLYDEIKAIFAKILVLPTYKIEPESNWINDLSGDSMNYIELIQSIENKYSISISEDEYLSLTCLSDFVACVADRQKNN